MTIATSGPDWAYLLETISVDIVCVAKAPGDGGIYSVTCTDADTGKVLGRRRIVSAYDGPPSITFDDIVEMMGGSYRCASVLVEIEGQKLMRRKRRKCLVVISAVDTPQRIRPSRGRF
jgi:hypothetical protein